MERGEIERERGTKDGNGREERDEGREKGALGVLEWGGRGVGGTK